MEQKYPYSDDDMIYDLKLHMYVLTPSYVERELGVQLTTYLDASGDSNISTLGERVLKRISRHLYNYIYTHTLDRYYLEYVLAKYPPCREIIKECLLNEVYYNLKNGDFYNYADSAIGGDKAVSPDTNAILNSALPNGFRLLYRGAISHPPFKLREGY